MSMVPMIDISSKFLVHYPYQRIVKNTADSQEAENGISAGGQTSTVNSERGCIYHSSGGITCS